MGGAGAAPPPPPPSKPRPPPPLVVPPGEEGGGEANMELEEEEGCGPLVPPSVSSGQSRGSARTTNIIRRLCSPEEKWEHNRKIGRLG